MFEYVRKGTASLENDPFTQFGCACHRSGTDIRTTSTPQTNGRVERMFRTLKSRLLTLLRLEGAITIEQANAFLHHYVEESIIRFDHTVDNTNSVFESSPSTERINLTLAVLTQRTKDNGRCLRLQNAFRRPADASGCPAHYRRGASCMVIQAIDGSLYTSIEQTVYTVDPSQDFGEPAIAPQPRKQYVPPTSPPWKANTCEAHVKAQSHSCDKPLPPVEDVIYSQEVF